MRTEKVKLQGTGAPRINAGDYCFCPFCAEMLFIPDPDVTLRAASKCGHFSHVEDETHAVFVDEEDNK